MSTNEAADRLRDYFDTHMDHASAMEAGIKLDAALASEPSAGATPLEERTDVEALDRTSERRPLAHLLTADEYQSIRERNADCQGVVRHRTGSDPVMDRDALIRHIDARAIAAERSAGAAPLDQHPYTGSCCDQPLTEHDYATIEWVSAQEWDGPVERSAGAAPLSCKHDWAINNDWDGGPAPYPIIQCIRCNEVSAGAAPLDATKTQLRNDAAQRDLWSIETEAHERSAGAAPIDVEALFASERFINAVIATFAAPGEQSEFTEHPARGYYRNAPEHFRDVLADRYARLSEGTDR